MTTIFQIERLEAACVDLLSRAEIPADRATLTKMRDELAAEKRALLARNPSVCPRYCQ